MKKFVFVALAAVFITTTGFSSVVNPGDEIEDFGRCHIEITNTRTGEVVYEITLPANTAEACEQMGQDTLDAIVDGTLKPNK